jgi:hypothetical protein
LAAHRRLQLRGNQYGPRLARRLEKQGVIIGGEDAHRFVDELRKMDISVLLSPLLFSLPDRAAQKAAQLLKGGLRAAFVSDMPEGEAWMLRTIFRMSLTFQPGALGHCTKNTINYTQQI